MKTSQWNRILLCAASIAVFFGSIVCLQAATAINPGGTYEFVGAEGAREEVSTCTGNNHCFTDWLSNEVDLGTILVEGKSQSVMSTITAYNSFLLSEGGERLVGAVLNGMVSWEGYLDVGSQDGARAAIDIRVELFDVTDNVTVASQAVHDESCSGTVADPCYSHDSGSGGIDLYANLVRGHTYEIRLTAQCKSDLNAVVTKAVCAYAPYSSSYGVTFGDGFITWSNFSLTVDPDTIEMINQLRLDLDNLTIAFNELKEQFLTHTHIYKTGKGVGHNNTDATTTPPVEGATETPGTSTPGTGTQNPGNSDKDKHNNGHKNGKK